VVGYDLHKPWQSAAVRDVETIRFAAVGERGRPRSDEEGVGCCNEVDVGFDQVIVALNSSPRTRLKPRLRSARLDVFMTIAKTLLYAQSEADVVPAFFDTSIDAVAPSRWQLNAKPSNRSAVMEAV
jgi:hypothetical protein